MGKNTQLLRLHLLSTVPTSYLSLLKLHRVLDSQSWSLNFTKTWDGNTTGDPLQERLLKWRLRRGWGRWASRSCGGATKAAFSAHVHQASNWREIWGCILKMPVLASTKKWAREICQNPTNENAHNVSLNSLWPLIPWIQLFTVWFLSSPISSQSKKNN